MCMEPFPLRALNAHGGEMHATYVNGRQVGGTTWSWERDGSLLVATISRAPYKTWGLAGGIVLGVLVGMVLAMILPSVGGGSIGWSSEGYCEWEGNPNPSPEDPSPAWWCKDDSATSWDESIWWGWCEMHRSGDGWECTDDYGFDDTHALSSEASRHMEADPLDVAFLPVPVLIGLAVFAMVGGWGAFASRGLTRFELDPQGREARLIRVMPGGGVQLLNRQPVDDVALLPPDQMDQSVFLQFDGMVTINSPMSGHLDIPLPVTARREFVQVLRSMFGHGPEESPPSVPSGPQTVNLSEWSTPAEPEPAGPLPQSQGSTSAALNAQPGPEVLSGEDLMPNAGENDEASAPFW